MRGDSGFPVRIRFAKRGKVRFISHRDVARAFERAFRIEQLPLAFTEGFSPRPKVSFGLALSVGHESDAEYLDVELTEPIDTEALPARLTLPISSLCHGSGKRLSLASSLRSSGSFLKASSARLVRSTNARRPLAALATTKTLDSSRICPS